MLSTWLIVLLLLEVQDESSKNFNVKKASKLILLLISSLKMFRLSSKSTDVMSFKTENNVAWLQECQEVNFFATIYDC